MSVGFWSTVIKPNGKAHTMQPPEGFVLNVQQLALLGGEKGSSYSVFVSTEPILGGDGAATKTLLGTLRYPSTEQFQTAMVFGYDVPLSFEVSANSEGGKSKGEVHISGYLQPGPSEEDDEDDYDDMAFGGMPYGYGEDDDDDEDDDEDEDDRFIENMVRGSGSDEDSEDDDSDDDNDYPRVEELPSVEEGVKRKKGNVKRKAEESDSDTVATSSDEEDKELDAKLIDKMIKRHRSDEKKNPAAAGHAGSAGSKGGSTKKDKSPTDSGKKKKNKGKGKGK